MGRIRIRAHHLDSFLWHRHDTRERFGEILQSQGYILRQDHPFVAYVHRVFQRLQNPSQRILVVIGEEDIICRRCPKRSYCEALHPEKSMLASSVFHDPDYLKGDKDRKMAEEYHVEHNREYTSGNIFPEITSQE